MYDDYRGVTATAHPRVSGENDLIAAIITTMMGSSPRERGKRGRYGCQAAAHGLIPA